MRAAMNGDTRVEVKLKEPIPVLIFYSTAVVLDGGEAHFYDDIYGLDAELEQILAQRKSGASSAEMPNER
jgi:murein L,D-transpeptidase YcbB/YkuD